MVQYIGTEVDKKFSSVNAGCMVRGGTNYTKKTTLLYITEGLFLRLILDHSKKYEERNFFNNLIDKYNIIIFDEAHMLSIHNEIGLHS